MEAGEAPRGRALSAALSLLRRRLHSEHEIGAALTRRGIEEPERAEILSYLRSHRLLDDAAFARAVVRSRDRLKPSGDGLLRLELRRRGVAGDVADAALTGRTHPDSTTGETLDMLAQAKRVIQAKERAYAHLELAVRERRLLALLMRRGFTYDVARAAIRP